MAIVFATLTSDLIAVLAALVAACAYYIHLRYSYWQRRGFQFLKPQFPFGNFVDTLLQRKSIGDLCLDLYRALDAPLVGIWTGWKPTLLVRDPEAIQSILVKDFAKFADRGVFSDAERDPLSGNLFALPGENWRHLRQKLSPTFTSGKLKAMFTTLVDCGGPLTSHMTKQADAGNVVEMRELLAQFTTNMIASVAFGLDIDCIREPDNNFRHFGRKVFANTLWNGLRGAVGLFCPSLMHVLRLKSVDQDVEDFFVSVARQNLKLREKEQVTRKDFFQLLVQLRNGGIQADGVWDTKVTDQTEDKKQLSLAQCAAQSFVFYTAGFETSSTTMAFALYELAKNPDCQRIVQAEIDEVLQRHKGAVTYESVADMKYLEAVIDETLRMYPPLPLLNRICSDTWTAPNSGGKTIEAGTPVIIPVYALHHDPQFYPNPAQFDPERFSAELLAADKSSGARPYLPFGDGPRNCVGLRLGKIQTKIGLIMLLQRYGFELSGNTTRPLVMSPNAILLAPVGGIQLRVSHRK